MDAIGWVITAGVVALAIVAVAVARIIFLRANLIIREASAIDQATRQ